MWTCPKCGRTFRNQNQGHFCGPAPKTIEEYILEQPEQVQPCLRSVNQAIREALPQAVEKISCLCRSAAGLSDEQRNHPLSLCKAAASCADCRDCSVVP